MVFSSLPFLYAFFPLVLALYYIVPNKVKNVVLLIFSFAFYWWGEPKYALLMLVTITVCYCGGLLTEKLRETRWAKPILIISVAVPLGFLAVFKYADFLTGSFNMGFTGQPVAHTDGVWNFLGMVTAGLAFALAGGCPGRQLFMAGEGDSDAAIFALGMIVGAAMAHNFGTASSGAGIGAYGIHATVIGFAVCLFIGFTNCKKA